MDNIDQEIENIKEYIRKTPYHKGTEREIGLLRAKIARLKAKKESRIQKSSSKSGPSYAVKKQGDATVVLVGPPSAGKSTLLNALTNAESKVAPYAFTTLTVIPGMMKYKDANIQILDVPGLIEGAHEGKGRGREVLSVVRGADLLLLMTDIDRPGAITSLKTSLEANGIRLDKTPPKLNIEKKVSGGLIIKSNIKQEIDEDTIKEIAREMGIKNAQIQLKQPVTADELIDAFSTNRVYIRSLQVVNKAEQTNKRPIKEAIYISAEDKKNLDRLKEAIWKKLELVRIYLLHQDEKPHKNNPFIVKKGISLGEVAEKIGNDFAANKKNAKIWGKQAKFPGQEVSLKKEILEEIFVKLTG